MSVQLFTCTLQLYSQCFHSTARRQAAGERSQRVYRSGEERGMCRSPCAQCSSTVSASTVLWGRAQRQAGREESQRVFRSGEGWAMRSQGDREHRQGFQVQEKGEGRGVLFRRKGRNDGCVEASI